MTGQPWHPDIANDDLDEDARWVVYTGWAGYKAQHNLDIEWKNLVRNSPPSEGLYRATTPSNRDYWTARYPVDWIYIAGLIGYTGIWEEAWEEDPPPEQGGTLYYGIDNTLHIIVVAKSGVVPTLDGEPLEVPATLRIRSNGEPTTTIVNPWEIVTPRIMVVGENVTFKGDLLIEIDTANIEVDAYIDRWRNPDAWDIDTVSITVPLNLELTMSGTDVSWDIDTAAITVAIPEIRFSSGFEIHEPTAAYAPTLLLNVPETADASIIPAELSTSVKIAIDVIGAGGVDTVPEPEFPPIPIPIPDEPPQPGVVSIRMIKSFGIIMDTPTIVDGKPQ